MRTPKIPMCLKEFTRSNFSLSPDDSKTKVTICPYHGEIDSHTVVLGEIDAGKVQAFNAFAVTIMIMFSDYQYREDAESIYSGLLVFVIDKEMLNQALRIIRSYVHNFT